MESDRPFREWPLEQLAEQAMLHRADAQVLAGLAAEAARRPGVRAKAIHARIRQMQDGAGPLAGAGVPELREMLAAAAGEIARLRARLVAVTAEEAGAGPHRRVYLTPDAPAWLIAEVRRAFRRRYHPDSQPDASRRTRAEEVFKRAEAVFTAIERTKQL